MLGYGSHFERARGEDRFYIPVKARKNRNQNKKQQKQQQEAVKKSEEKDNNDTSSLWPSQKSKTVVLDSRKISKEPCLLSAVSDSEASLVSRSNLQRFLESTTPLVPAQYFSKTTVRGRRTCNVEFQPYFTLGDLWSSFEEWSAYGAGVPLVLYGRDCVVQYYVPYLSGIQLYVESLQSDAKLRPKEESNGDYYKDSSSDGTSGYEIEEGIKFPREKHHYNNFRNEIPFRMNGLSISDESNATQEGFSSDDSEAGSSRHCLVFEFLDQDSPYCRLPLADKISDIACHYPRLKTLRSFDLLPISWMSVAWYPIYRIPTGQTLKDLDACFLTYHSLSTPTEGNGSNHSPILVYPNEQDGIPKISLPPFGMASYKFKGSMWTPNGLSEHQLTNSLTKAAENWLRLLQVIHPDFQFFASHGIYHR